MKTKEIAMSTRTKNAQSSSALLVEATPGLDQAEVERALAGCAGPAPAARTGLSVDVIDGAVNRARVRGAIGESLPGGGRLSDEVIDELLAGARTEEEVFGPGGVFAALTKRLVERAMEVELTDHLGYEPHYEPPGGAGNTRNGSTSKTLVTEHGKVAIDAPRDRDGSFEPQIVRKRQRRFKGFDEKILALYSRGLSTRDIQAHLYEIYGVNVSPELISRVTDAVMDDARAWQPGPWRTSIPSSSSMRWSSRSARTGPFRNVPAISRWRSR